jgi:hypothetical protein
MPKSLNRRHFMGKSLVAGGALTAGLTFEHQPLLARLKGKTMPSQAESSAAALPMSRIGKLKVTRLTCGGNLFSGFAHSGNLLYVSSLLKHYFTPEKIMDTLQISEESGINTAILRTDDHTYPKIDNLRENIQLAIDNGAVGAFMMGGIGDDFFKQGRLDLIGEVIHFMKRNGLAAGVGSHMLDVPKAAEREKIDPDFYFKTFNAVGYESQEPAEIGAFMKTVKKPWIAFKVLGAGRAKPRDGFDLAFKLGADFVNVGMYDFQVKEDVAMVKEIVNVHAQRERSWSA